MTIHVYSNTIHKRSTLTFQVFQEMLGWSVKLAAPAVSDEAFFLLMKELKFSMTFHP